MYRNSSIICLSRRWSFLIVLECWEWDLVFGLRKLYIVMTIVETGQNVLSPSITRHCSAVYQDHGENATGPSDSIISAYKPSAIVMAQGAMKNPIPHSDNREFVCGWGAAFINITVTFPVNKLMFRQMLHGISSEQALHELKKEGLKNMYRGILPPLCQKTVSTSIMFGMYEKYKQLFKKHFPSLSSSGAMAAAAALAGCTEALLCPLERIQTIMQDKKFHGMYKNTMHCAKGLHKFGFSEYYRGLYLILFRNSASNILFFGLRKEIKETVPSFGNSWYEDFLVDFLSGALLGAFISTVMYPTNVVKAHQQSQVGGPFQSVRETFLFVYEARGRRLRRLFKGVHVNYTRALMSWGIINASYEILLKTLYS